MIKEFIKELIAILLSVLKFIGSLLFGITYAYIMVAILDALGLLKLLKHLFNL